MDNIFPILSNYASEEETNLVSCNSFLNGYGIKLSKRDIKLLIERKKEILKTMKRLEFRRRYSY